MRYKVGQKIYTTYGTERKVIKVNEEENYYVLDGGGYYTDSEINHEATAKLTLPQPSKDMLRSGMKVVYRDGSFAYALVEIFKFISDVGKTDSSFSKLHKDLTHINGTNYDIMQIWDGDTLIAQRTEKSEAELKKESLEKQINECSDKIKNLYVCIENLELEIKSL